MPRAKRTICAYTERGQRCRRNGHGNPPLCEAHRLVLEAELARPARPGERLVGLLTRVLRGQRVTDQHVEAGISDLMGMFDDGIDMRQFMHERAHEHMRRTGHAAPRAAPATRPAAPDPRAILGFAPGQKLTLDEVKRRHRELARRHHPDRGGSVARMQEINQAVDAILASL